jgi:hypothetical protein
VVTDRGEKAERRAARELVVTYREGFACFDAGELDALSSTISSTGYKHSARELWKICARTGGQVVSVARMLEDMRKRDELPDWWYAGRTPSEWEGRD